MKKFDYKNRNPKLFLTDILDSLEKIELFTQNLVYESFVGNIKTTDAVLRNIEVMGEASKHIPDEIRELYPQIPFKKIAGMRDKLIHDYLGINYKLIFETIKTRFPELKEIVRAALKEE